MNILKLLRTLFICTSLWLPPGIAFSSSDSGVAKVIIMRGTVEAINADGSKETLSKGGWVKEGAKVQTQAKSFVKLLFTDKSQMNLGPKSEMLIEKFPKKKAGIISLMKGSLRSKVTKDYLKNNGDKKSKLFIKTKSAAMGVRGTDFSVTPSSLDVISGEVRVINKPLGNIDQDSMDASLNSNQAASVRKGQTTSFNGNSSRPVIKAIPKARLEKLKKSDAPSSTEAKTEKKEKKKEDKKEEKVAKKEEKKEKKEEKKEQKQEQKTAKKEDKKQEKKSEPKSEPKPKKEVTSKESKENKKQEPKAKTVQNEPKPKPKAEPKNVAKAEAKPEPKPEPKTEPKIETKKAAANEPKPSPAPAPKQTARPAPAPVAPVAAPAPKPASIGNAPPPGPVPAPSLGSAPPAPMPAPSFGAAPPPPMPAGDFGNAAAPPPMPAPDVSGAINPFQIGGAKIDDMGSSVMNAGGVTDVAPPPPAPINNEPAFIAPPPPAPVMGGGETFREPASATATNTFVEPAGATNSADSKVDGGGNFNEPPPTTAAGDIAGAEPPPPPPEMDVYEVLYGGDTAAAGDTKTETVVVVEADSINDAIGSTVEDINNEINTQNALNSGLIPTGDIKPASVEICITLPNANSCTTPQ